MDHTLYHVLFIPSWYPSPDNPINGIFVRDRAQALKKHGHQVGIIAPQFYSLRMLGRVVFQSGYEEFSDSGIAVHRYCDWAWLPKIPYGNSALWLRAGLKLFKRYVRKHGMPDLLHAHNSLMGGILAAELKRIYAIPFVLTEEGAAFDVERDRHPPWLAKLITHALNQADAIIAVSSQLAGFLSQRFTLPSCRISWIGNIVEERFFQTDLSRKRLKNEEFCFLNVGNLNANKGHADLLRAFTFGFRDKPGVHLRVIGDGPERATLERLCRSLEVEGRVRFLGRLDRAEVVREMTACDVFVLPSHYETFGIAVAEALACGKPVVATQCWGPASYVTDTCGIIVPSRDWRALMRAMADVMRNHENYDPNQLREYSRSLFNSDVVAQKTVEIYQGVVSTQPADLVGALKITT